VADPDALGERAGAKCPQESADGSCLHPDAPDVGPATWVIARLPLTRGLPSTYWSEGTMATNSGASQTSKRTAKAQALGQFTVNSFCASVVPAER
jgi:hypothetical protein